LIRNKKNVFFDRLLGIAANHQLAIKVFKQELNDLSNAENFAAEMKRLEEIGDNFSHEIILALNKTFITPFEREDIMGLTLKLDDVLDCLEACASRLELYNIAKADRYMLLFTSNIEACIQEIAYAINHLVDKRLSDMGKHTQRINELENEGDTLLRESLKALFSSNMDAIELIKRKEIYDMMEAVSDSCEDVADIMEGLIMRSS